MTTDPRDVFREIDATEVDSDFHNIPLGDDETVTCQKQTFHSTDIEEVERMEQLFVESVLLDALDQQESADVRDGVNVDLDNRRVIVDPSRIGYRVVWDPLHIVGTEGEDLRAEKEIGYVVTDTEAVR